MMNRMGRMMIGGAALAVLAACSGGDSNGNSRPPPTAITINLVSSPLPAFQPAVDTIAAGGTVTWQWDAGLHDVTSFSVSGSPTFTDIPDNTGRRRFRPRPSWRWRGPIISSAATTPPRPVLPATCAG